MLLEDCLKNVWSWRSHRQHQGKYFLVIQYITNTVKDITVSWYKCRKATVKRKSGLLFAQVVKRNRSWERVIHWGGGSNSRNRWQRNTDVNTQISPNIVIISVEEKIPPSFKNKIAFSFNMQKAAPTNFCLI